MSTEETELIEKGEKKIKVKIQKDGKEEVKEYESNEHGDFDAETLKLFDEHGIDLEEIESPKHYWISRLQEERRWVEVGILES